MQVFIVCNDKRVLQAQVNDFILQQNLILLLKERLTFFDW
jgi:hypothetical protein